MLRFSIIRAMENELYNCNHIGTLNSGVFGLPFSESESRYIIFPLSWDVSCTYGSGSAASSLSIKQASCQLDLWDTQDPAIWKKGIYMTAPSMEWQGVNRDLREKAIRIYRTLEQGAVLTEVQIKDLAEINSQSKLFLDWGQSCIESYLAQGKKLILLGGDHSVSLAYINALSTLYDSFGILQIDAHMDLRQAYAGFEYSHASVMFNALQLDAVQTVVQVGVRDCCEEEVSYAQSASSRVQTFFDKDIARDLCEGRSWSSICDDIIRALPDNIYITCDVDGLAHTLFPSTGTPVPGGVTYQQWLYLLERLSKSEKTILGVDLVEVVPGNTDLESNIAARLLYQYCLAF